jgi:hypothetical protein
MAPVFNGQPVDQAITDPAFIDAQIDSFAVGKIDFKNSSDPASGPFVLNIQQNVNYLIQNDKIFIGTSDNSKVSFDGTSLSFTADLVVYFKDTNVTNRILAASSPISIPDGQSLYFTTNRTANATVTAFVAGTVPQTLTAFRFCTRISGALIFWDNTMCRAGTSIRIGEGGSSTLATQEVPLGVCNGINTVFTLSQNPINDASVMMWLDTVPLYQGNDYTITGQTITFVTPPAAGQSPYAFYLISGDATPVTSTGVMYVEYFTLSATDITNKYVTLANTPFQSSKVILDIISGSAQEYGVDYYSTTNQVNWDSMTLDGLLASGDRLRVIYFT